MALPLPSSMSPSKVSTFTSCALAFRFSAIDRLPEAPSLAAVRGTTVHKALELLFGCDAAERTPATAEACLHDAVDEMSTDEDYLALELDDGAAAAFRAEAGRMVRRYFTLEDPRTIRPVGLELMLEAELDGVLVRGIIDRLEEDGDGQLVVTDYKTGRTPSVMQEQSRLGGVHFYAFLCEQVYGRVPARIQLVYLGDQPQVITTTPSAQSIRGTRTKISAVWSAVERACEHDDFRPKRSALCNWCSFQSYCPEFGGDPAEAARLRPTPIDLTATDARRAERSRAGAHAAVTLLAHPGVVGLDAAVDRVAARLRGDEVLDRLFYGLSEAANHSLLWHGINAVDALVGGPSRRRAAVRRSAVLAAEQALVNGPVKLLARRERPVELAAHPHALRQPRTSSFPSGHASAAACAATLLSHDLGHRGRWWVLATLVAWSRIHVGVHHGSDVVAGAALGRTIALAATRRRRHAGPTCSATR